MNTTLSLIVGAFFASSLLVGCAASNQPNPQFSELENKCLQSGGLWRSGSCEQPSSGGGY